MPVDSSANDTSLVYGATSYMLHLFRGSGSGFSARTDPTLTAAVANTNDHSYTV